MNNLLALFEELTNRINCLKLSDLLDVSDCLEPERGETLTYTGVIWNSAAIKKTMLELAITPILTEGNPIAVFNYNGTSYTIYETLNKEISVTPELTSGIKIADITIDDEITSLYLKDSSKVSVKSNLNKGTVIGSITVDGVKTTLYAPTNDGGTLNNIKINNILGTVEDKLASVTLTGADIKATGYRDSTFTNNALLVLETDTINESLGKLQKALKDNEATISRAIASLLEATGFDENLHYVPINKDVSHPEWDVISKNASPAPSVSKVLLQIIAVINNLSSMIDSMKNHTLKFSGGAVIKKGTNPFSVGNANHNEFEVEITPTVIENLTKKNPLNLPSGQYYNLEILSDTNEPVWSYIDVYLRTMSMTAGSLITFLTDANTWLTYLYVGPVVNGHIQHSDWAVRSNWVKVFEAQKPNS